MPLSANYTRRLTHLHSSAASRQARTEENRGDTGLMAIAAASSFRPHLEAGERGILRVSAGPRVNSCTYSERSRRTSSLVIDSSSSYVLPPQKSKCEKRKPNEKRQRSEFGDVSLSSHAPTCHVLPHRNWITR